MKRSPDLTKLLGFFEPTIQQRVGYAFDLMQIAEEEIERAKKHWPRRAKAIHGAFGILTPGDLITTGEDLYRAHCRELLCRVMKGEDVGPGTDAECCLCFMNASLKAPPTNALARAYGVVFARVLPQHADIVKDVGREDYTGQLNEIIEGLRKKIGQLTGRSLKKAA